MVKGHTQEGTWGGEGAVEAYPYFSGEDPDQMCDLAKLFYRPPKEFVNRQGKLRCLFKHVLDFS